MEFVSKRQRLFNFLLGTLALLVFLFTTDAANVLSDPPVCPQVADESKFDCLPGQNATKDDCDARGCCWQEVTNQNKSGPYNPDFPEDRFPIHIGAPSCYYPSSFPSYSYLNQSDTTYGKMAYLQRNGTSHFPGDVQFLRIDVYFDTKSRLRVKITDAESDRYEVSVPKLPTTETAATNTDYTFKFHDNVGFSIIRNSTNEVLFDTSVGSFIYSNRFIQLSALLSTQNLYGLGDSNDDFQRSFDWQLIPLFASYFFPDYGSHPFYLQMEKSHQSHGVFLFNSNAMDILLQPTPAITYRTTGGVLDFYFFLGPTPNEVIEQYTTLMGKPNLPPYWSLGFHLSKYNYLTAEATREAWIRNVEAGIPFDTQWNDIDYMDNYKIFTYDETNFATLPQFVDELHSKHMHYVPIIDCGVYVQPEGTYETYDEGVKMDIFVKNNTGGYATGRVWPEHAVFPDFTHPYTSSFWTNGYRRLYKQIKFDGAWIDMNEPATFSAGTFDGEGCPQTDEDFPPYVPAVEGGELFAHTICMSSKHYDDVPHYNIHSMYGFTEAIATQAAMKEITGKRPFVLSRSTFPGHGFYANHWTGDVYSKWHDLKQSIPDMLNFNLFGIPMVGADICGFRGNTTLQLCQRWTTLGAFYPFCRNHNENITNDQDPVALGEEMVETAINVLKLRYTLLPFFYTQFYRAHLFGGTVVRPLFFEFPDDESTYDNQAQYLWGTNLMVMPVLDENVTAISPYFPKGVWYLFPNFTSVNSKGQNVTFDVSYDDITVAVRGHSMIVTQSSSQTTYDSRKNMFGLIVALCEEGMAEGELYWDSGESIDPIESNEFTHITFQAKNNTLTSNVVTFNYPGDVPMVLGSIKVPGVTDRPNNVVVNGQNHQFNYTENKVLELEDLSIDLSEPLTVTWSFAVKGASSKTSPIAGLITLIISFFVYRQLF